MPGVGVGGGGGGGGGGVRGSLTCALVREDTIAFYFYFCGLKRANQSSTFQQLIFRPIL